MIRADYQFAYSRFRSLRTFTEDEEMFTCCSFSVMLQNDWDHSTSDKFVCES